MNDDNRQTFTVWTKLGKDGRIVIPAKVRRAIGANPGDGLGLQVIDGELRIFTKLHGIKQFGEYLRQVFGDQDPVEELIAERRAEAARE